MKAAIAYRVSTAQQGYSGLGLEVQQAALTRFAEAEGYALVEMFEEVEAGKGSDASIAGRNCRPPQGSAEAQGAHHRRQARPTQPRRA